MAARSSGADLLQATAAKTNEKVAQKIMADRSFSWLFLRFPIKGPPIV
jgi:hypothetical protein